MNIWDEKTQQLRLFNHYVFSDNLLYLFFTMYFVIFCHDSQYLAPTLYCRDQSLSHLPPQQNIRQLFLSFRKVPGCTTSLISWFIDFNIAKILNKINFLSCSSRVLIITFGNYLNKLVRSSRPEVFSKKGVIENFAKFTEKH